LLENGLHAISIKKKSEKSKRCTDCKASINIEVKKLNKDTKKNDRYLRDYDPALQAVIVINPKHNHNLHSFDAMSYLRSTKATRQTFLNYFKDGHGVAASISLHEAKIEMEENSAVVLGNSALNPLNSTVQHWYRLWREENYGDDRDILTKLREKAAIYEKEGKLILACCLLVHINTISTTLRKILIFFSSRCSCWACPGSKKPLTMGSNNCDSINGKSSEIQRGL